MHQSQQHRGIGAELDKLDDPKNYQSQLVTSLSLSLCGDKMARLYFTLLDCCLGAGTKLEPCCRKSRIVLQKLRTKTLVTSHKKERSLTQTKSSILFDSSWQPPKNYKELLLVKRPSIPIPPQDHQDCDDSTKLGEERWAASVQKTDHTGCALEVLFVS